MRGLRLLGVPRLDVAGNLSDLPLDKPASLLYYLARRRDWVSRSELAFLYRPDAPEKVALSNVRVYIYRAKEHPWAKDLEVEKFRVRFLVETDVGAFEKALEQQAWSTALELYRGSLLEGIVLHDVPGYETWLELERQDLSRKWRTAALSCAHELEERRDFAGAGGWLEQVLRANPLDEEALQIHLRVLFSANKRTQALEAYENFRAELQRELDVDPLETTRTLIASLSQGEPEAVTVRGKPKRHNLPAQTTRFVGRKRELGQLSETLAKPECRLMTLVGLGGAGKTRLALELASKQLLQYPDGVWFVPLAGVGSPDLLVSSIASSAGFTFSGPSDPKEQLANFFREKELLVLLDNFEQLVDGAVLLEELLEVAPKLKLLVTSRVALGLTGEWLFDVEGLAYPPIDTEEPLASFDAVSLFRARAERLSFTFICEGETLDAVAELTRKVEGSPLALELAASWTRSLGVSQLLAELDKNIDLLSSQLRDLPERHRSMRTVFEYSWQRLNAKKRDALAKLSIFQGGFTLKAAEQIADVHLALLLSLINHSLVRKSQEGRYQLHELVRQYAASLLDGRLESALKTNFSAYYLGLLARHRNDLRSFKQKTIKNLLLKETDNFRLACRVALKNSAWQALDEAIDTLQILLQRSGRLNEGKELFEQLAGAAQVTVTSGKRLKARALRHLGTALRDIGLLPQAIARLAESIAMLRELDLKDDLVSALYTLAGAYFISDQLSSGEPYLDESERLSRELENDLMRSDILLALAWMHRQRGQYEEAIAVLEACLQLREQQGDILGVVEASTRYGMLVYEAQADYNRAEQYFQKALETSRQLDDKKNETRALNCLASLAFYEGHYTESEHLYREVIALEAHIGAVKNQMTNLANLGEVLSETGQYESSAAYLQKALDLSYRVNSPTTQHHVYGVLAKNAQRQADYIRARTYFQKSLGVTRSATIAPDLILDTLYSLAHIYLEVEQEEAFLLAKFIENHQNCLKAINDSCRDLAEQIGATLSSRVAKALEDKAKTLSLEAMLERQLILLESKR